MITENFRRNSSPIVVVGAVVIAAIFLTPILVAINTSLKAPAEVLDVFSLPAVDRKSVV